MHFCGKLESIIKVGAVIPAAGLSSRMNSFKPLLQLGGQTIIERDITLFTSVGIADVVVVLGNRAGELVPVIERTSARHILNPDYRDGMFSSIQKGASELQGEIDCFFLLPVDIPLVQKSSLNLLLTAFMNAPETLVCYPTYQNRRGHPPLIASSLIEPIVTYHGHGGLRGLLQEYQPQTKNIDTNDPFVLMDVDTPEDFSRLEQLYTQLS